MHATAPTEDDLDKHREIEYAFDADETRGRNVARTLVGDVKWRVIVMKGNP